VLVVLGILSVSLPLTTKLVKEKQNIESNATGNKPIISCNSTAGGKYLCFDNVVWKCVGTYSVGVGTKYEWNRYWTGNPGVCKNGCTTINTISSSSNLCKTVTCSSSKCSGCTTPSTCSSAGCYWETLTKSCSPKITKKTTTKTCTYNCTAWTTCNSSGKQTCKAQTKPQPGCTGGTTKIGTTQNCTPAKTTTTKTTPKTCTSFTYTDWTPASCPSSGRQTRTVKTSSPSGCTGGTRVTSRNCSPPTPTKSATKTTCSYICTKWGSCSSGWQTCTTDSKLSTSQPNCTGGRKIGTRQKCTPATSSSNTTTKTTTKDCICSKTTAGKCDLGSPSWKDRNGTSGSYTWSCTGSNCNPKNCSIKKITTTNTTTSKMWYYFNGTSCVGKTYDSPNACTSANKACFSTYDVCVKNNTPSSSTATTTYYYYDQSKKTCTPTTSLNACKSITCYSALSSCQLAHTVKKTTYFYYSDSVKNCIGISYDSLSACNTSLGTCYTTKTACESANKTNTNSSDCSSSACGKCDSTNCGKGNDCLWGYNGLSTMYCYPKTVEIQPSTLNTSKLKQSCNNIGGTCLGSLNTCLSVEKGIVIKNTDCIAPNYICCKSNSTSTTASKPESIEVTNIELTTDSNILYPNSNKKIMIKILPDGISDRIIWSSSDGNKAIVGTTGLVKGVAPGEVTITATASNGKSDSIKITVESPLKLVSEKEKEEIKNETCSSNSCSECTLPSDCSSAGCSWENLVKTCSPKVETSTSCSASKCQNCGTVTECNKFPDNCEWNYTTGCNSKKTDGNCDFTIIDNKKFESEFELLTEKDLCLAGTLNNKNSTDKDFNWECIGQNDGESKKCQITRNTQKTILDSMLCLFKDCIKFTTASYLFDISTPKIKNTTTPTCNESINGTYTCLNGEVKECLKGRNELWQWLYRKSCGEKGCQEGTDKNYYGTQNLCNTVVYRISVFPKEFTLLKGEKIFLEASVKDNSGIEIPDLSVNWKSSDPKIVSVDPTTGNVTAISTGTATITASTNISDITASSKITVKDMSITTDKETIILGLGESTIITTLSWPESSNWIKWRVGNDKLISLQLLSENQIVDNDKNEVFLKQSFLVKSNNILGNTKIIISATKNNKTIKEIPVQVINDWKYKISPSSLKLTVGQSFKGFEVVNKKNYLQVSKDKLKITTSPLNQKIISIKEDGTIIASSDFTGTINLKFLINNIEIGEVPVTVEKCQQNDIVCTISYDPVYGSYYWKGKCNDEGVFEQTEICENGCTPNGKDCFNNCDKDNCGNCKIEKDCENQIDRKFNKQGQKTYFPCKWNRYTGKCLSNSINAVCNTIEKYKCSQGEVNQKSKKETGAIYKWSCDGLYGGKNADCDLLKDNNCEGYMENSTKCIGNGNYKKLKKCLRANWIEIPCQGLCVDKINEEKYSEAICDNRYKKEEVCPNKNFLSSEILTMDKNQLCLQGKYNIGSIKENRSFIGYSDRKEDSVLNSWTWTCHIETINIDVTCNASNSDAEQCSKDNCVACNKKECTNKLNKKNCSWNSDLGCISMKCETEDLETCLYGKEVICQSSNFKFTGKQCCSMSTDNTYKNIINTPYFTVSKTTLKSNRQSYCNENNSELYSCTWGKVSGKWETTDCVAQSKVCSQINVDKAKCVDKPTTNTETTGKSSNVSLPTTGNNTATPETVKSAVTEVCATSGNWSFECLTAKTKSLLNL